VCEVERLRTLVPEASTAAWRRLQREALREVGYRAVAPSAERSPDIAVDLEARESAG